MSLYGEYKAGLIDEHQYIRASREEEAMWDRSDSIWSNWEDDDWSDEEVFYDDDIDDF